MQLAVSRFVHDQMDLPALRMVLYQTAEAFEPLLQAGVQLPPIVEDSQYAIELGLFGKVRHHHDVSAKSPDAKFQRVILPVRQVCNLLGDGVGASHIPALFGCFLGSSDEINQGAEFSPASRSRVARLNELCMRMLLLSADDTTTGMKSLTSISSKDHDAGSG